MSIGLLGILFVLVGLGVIAAIIIGLVVFLSDRRKAGDQ